MNVLDITRLTIHEARLLSPGERVVVAVSGGPDSVCLLHVLCRLQPELSLDLHVAHLNHGLRGQDAADDAAFVAQLAMEWGIAATIEQADVRAYQKANRLSLEAAARQVRYDFLRRVAVNVGAHTVALGHTADDQVETILMHFLRGAGLTGLRGMSPVENWPGTVRLIRPLLSVTRRDIEAYLLEHGLRYRTDASNEDESIWRNRLRRRVLPFLETLSPTLRQTLLRTAGILADEDAYLEDQVRRVWDEIVSTATRAATVDLSRWRGLPVALQRRLLRAAWKHVSGHFGDLSWSHVEKARSVIDGPVGGRLPLPSRVWLERGYQSFSLVGPGGSVLPALDVPFLTNDEVVVPIPGSVALADGQWRVRTHIEPHQSSSVLPPPEPLCERFDADVVGEHIALRRWRRGDRMQPLGMVGSRKVHDIMIDARLPRALRVSVPLVVAGEHILWVVGLRRSEWGKVTSDTRRVLCVKFERQ